MSTVYVVQNQHRLDQAKQSLVPKFDLHSAEEFGTLSYLLSPTASPFRPDPIVAELRTKLFNFGDDDYLLLIGNPVLIGCAVAIASEINHGRVKMLQWSGSDRRYIRVPVDLNKGDFHE